MTKNADLPFASTLCGSCSNVCPVKINIHEQLYEWRQELTRQGKVDFGKKMGLKMMSTVLSNPRVYRSMGKMGRWTMRAIPGMVSNSFNPWFKQREMPAAPKESFREWYLKNRS